MRTLNVLHTNRLVVLLGSALLCLLGFVAGCDSGPTGTAAPTEGKAKEEAELKARQQAYGKSGIAPNTAKAAHAKPKS